MEENATLVIPSVECKDSFLVGLAKLQAEGWQMDEDLNVVAQDFPAFIKRLADEEQGLNLRPGRVAQTTRWLIVNGKFAGRVAIRHELNDFLRKIGGHIGYDIVPEYRLRGYGTMMLAEGLKIAKMIGIGKVLLTVNENNIGSQKIIKKHGGGLVDIVDMGEGKPRKMRFWIQN